MKNARWIEKLDMLPPDGRGRIRRYIEEGFGASLSTFYRCLLSNDLIGAVQGGDEENRAALTAYVEYLTAHAPEGCYGSAEKLHSWRGMSREAADMADAPDLTDMPAFARGCDNMPSDCDQPWSTTRPSSTPWRASGSEE